MDNEFDERNDEFGENGNTENNSNADNMTGNSFENQYFSVNKGNENIDASEGANEETNFDSDYVDTVQEGEPVDESLRNDDIIDSTAEEEPFEPESYEEPEEPKAAYNKTEEFARRRNEERSNSGRYEEEIKEPKPKKKSGGGWKKAIAVAVIIGVLGGIFSGIGYGIATRNKKDKEAAAILQEDGAKEVESKETPVITNNGVTYSAKEIIKNVAPAVVNINVEAEGTTTYWGMYEVPYSYKGAGSGVIFSESDEEVYIIQTAML